MLLEDIACGMDIAAYSVGLLHLQKEWHLIEWELGCVAEADAQLIVLAHDDRILDRWRVCDYNVVE